MSVISKGVSSIIMKLEENDASLTQVDFSNNSSYSMKATQYTEQIAKALETNTVLEELKLVNCNILDIGAKALGEALKKNQTLKLLDLSKNKIGSDGVIALADGLRENKTLTDLGLLNQSAKPGEGALSSVVEMFEHNTTLKNINWRLDSRQSFKINACLTRNKEIARRNKSGLSTKELDPAIRAGLKAEDGSETPRTEEDHSKEEVKQPQKEEVKQPQKEEVKQPQKEEVKQPQKEEVKQPQKEEVKQPQKEEVKQPQKEEVKQPQKQEVKQTPKQEVKQPQKQEAKQPPTEPGRTTNPETKTSDSQSLQQKILQYQTAASQSNAQPAAQQSPQSTTQQSTQTTTQRSTQSTTQTTSQRSTPSRSQKTTQKTAQSGPNVTFIAGGLSVAVLVVGVLAWWWRNSSHSSSG